MFYVLFAQLHELIFLTRKSGVGVTIYTVCVAMATVLPLVEVAGHEEATSSQLRIQNDRSLNFAVTASSHMISL